MRTPLLAATALASLLCSSCKAPVVVPGKSASLEIDVRAASEPDALFGASEIGSLAMKLVPEDPSLDEATLFLNVSDGELTETSPGAPLEGLNGERLQVFAWGRDLRNATSLSFGRSAPVTLPDEGTARASIFLARSDVFSRLDASTLARDAAAVVQLDDGRVLLVGGRLASGAAGPSVVYDHATGDVVEVGTELFGRFAAACALPGGRALVAGGLVAGVASARLALFDGASLVPLAPLPSPRYGAGLLCFGEDEPVLLVGGLDGDEARDEIFELMLSGAAVTVTTSPVRLATARAFSSPAPIDTALGRMWLLSGGLGSAGAALGTAELVRLRGGAVDVVPPSAGGNPAALVTLGAARSGHAAISLGDGAVLLWGGADDDAVLADPSPMLFSAVISDPGAFLPVALDGDPTLPGVIGVAGAPLPDGSVLLAGGADTSVPALRFLPAPDQDPSQAATFRGSVVELAPSAARVAGHALALPDDGVLLVGGRAQQSLFSDEPGTPRPLAEIFVSCAIDDRCDP